MEQEIKYKALQAQIFNLRFWVDTIDSEKLLEVFNQLLEETEFTILKFSEHHFPVKGYTALWLLAESHLAVHTFPDNGWTYVELSGCNKEKTLDFKDKVQDINLNVQWADGEISVTLPEK